MARSLGFVPRLGNDVVDIDDPRCAGKHEHARFVERVFTSAERVAIRASPEPIRALWSRWAAKEAAFKVVSKIRGAPPPFQHRAFAVDLDSACRRGVVRYAEFEVPLRVEAGPQGWLHAIAGDPRDRDMVSWGAHLTRVASLDESGTNTRELFTPRELAAIHSAASAQVRLGARRDLARALDVDEARLEIACSEGPPGRVPPVVLLDGDQASADVSLSHHGRWIAWAVTVGAGG